MDLCSILGRFGEHLAKDLRGFGIFRPGWGQIWGVWPGCCRTFALTSCWAFVAGCPGAFALTTCWVFVAGCLGTFSLTSCCVFVAGCPGALWKLGTDLAVLLRTLVGPTFRTGTPALPRYAPRSVTIGSAEQILPLLANQTEPNRAPNRGHLLISAVHDKSRHPTQTRPNQASNRAKC